MQYRDFINLEKDKYYQFYFGGKHRYKSGMIGKVEVINNDYLIFETREQVSRTFFVTMPNSKNVNCRFGIYFWDKRNGSGRIYQENETIDDKTNWLCDGIHFVVELSSIQTDEDYYEYIKKVKENDWS